MFRRPIGSDTGSAQPFPNSTRIPLRSSSYNPDATDQASQVNPSRISRALPLRSDLCQVELANSVSFSLTTSSPSPGQMTPSPWQTQELHKITYATNPFLAKNSKEQIFLSLRVIIFNVFSHAALKCSQCIVNATGRQKLCQKSLWRSMVYNQEASASWSIQRLVALSKLF